PLSAKADAVSGARRMAAAAAAPAEAIMVRRLTPSICARLDFMACSLLGDIHHTTIYTWSRHLLLRGSLAARFEHTRDSSRKVHQYGLASHQLSRVITEDYDHARL